MFKNMPIGTGTVLNAFDNPAALSSWDMMSAPSGSWVRRYVSSTPRPLGPYMPMMDPPLRPELRS
jgi:hypothetical protein